MPTLEAITQLDSVVDVSLVKYQPGDILVLRCTVALLTEESVKAIEKAIEKHFGDKLKVMVMSEELSIHGLLREV